MQHRLAAFSCYCLILYIEICKLLLLFVGTIKEIPRCTYEISVRHIISGK